uniref:Uncharacterized protein n=1 Tax=Parascaris univalens TaxID=6257 RepID=A0A914ZWS5_PARUN
MCSSSCAPVFFKLKIRETAIVRLGTYSGTWRLTSFTTSWIQSSSNIESLYPHKVLKGDRRNAETSRNTKERAKTRRSSLHLRAHSLSPQEDNAP